MQILKHARKNKNKQRQRNSESPPQTYFKGPKFRALTTSNASESRLQQELSFNIGGNTNDTGILKDNLMEFFAKENALTFGSSSHTP